ncbi:hypothetical protein IV203_014682 [Nitzschia inconspicua]|uniref:Uncharacterized protein n=1 Tax=Nitzschia inconspicua TaxID=303405 RepID=A0A9K3LAH5_9STRA|nr:hypothetical protein IV203_014682 [Nitzschia inconspicua]
MQGQLGTIMGDSETTTEALFEVRLRAEQAHWSGPDKIGFGPDSAYVTKEVTDLPFNGANSLHHGRTAQTLKGREIGRRDGTDKIVDVGRDANRGTSINDDRNDGVVKEVKDVLICVSDGGDQERSAALKVERNEAAATKAAWVERR